MVPTTMHALLFDRPATDASATSVRTVPTPRPGPGEVLLRVSHAGVNFKDVMARRGDPGYVASWPFIPGLEAAGTVVAVGPDVTDFKVGDRLCALTNTGGLAQYAVARADLCAVVPDEVPLALAAAAPGALTTASLLLEQIARVRDGDVIVVHSAAGAVGTAIAAIARSRERVTLIGTVGDNTRAAAARQSGYDHVLVRGPRLSEQVAIQVGPHAVDVVLDSQGTSQLEADLAMLTPSGRIVIFGNAAGDSLADAPPMRELLAANAAIGGFSLAALSVTRPALIGDTISSVLRRLAKETLHLDITELDGLDHVAAAQQSLATGAGAIKYVIRLNQDAASRMNSEPSVEASMIDSLEG